MQELLSGALIFAIYVLPAAAVMMIARRFLRIADELFRKILHFILLGAYIPLLYAFQTWWISAGFSLAVIVLVYPILALAGRIPAFSTFVNERKKGEFKSSLILALSVAAGSTAICWGIFDDKLLVLACVYAWGVGDAFAALIGKRFGKHKIRLRFADPHKSIEGSCAMFACSVLSVFTVLMIRGGLHGMSCLIIALAAAAATTFVELCTKGGNDTVTCPLTAMLIILPLVQLLGA